MCFFDVLMINLTTCLNEEKRFRECQPDHKLGENRYKNDYIGISPDCDAIRVFQPKKKDLNFAIKVAKHYNCRYKIMAHENCPEGGEFEIRIYF